jgi:hypothetical protein
MKQAATGVDKRVSAALRENQYVEARTQLARAQAERTRQLIEATGRGLVEAAEVRDLLQFLLGSLRERHVAIAERVRAAMPGLAEEAFELMRREHEDALGLVVDALRRLEAGDGVGLAVSPSVRLTEGSGTR